MNDKSMVIICRGKSVDKLDLELVKEYGWCALVNTWDNIGKFPEICDLVRARRFVHYVNRMSMARLSHKNYQDLGIDFAQLNTLKRHKLKNSNTSFFRNNGIPFRSLGKEMIEHANFIHPETGEIGFPSTGSLSVIHAVKTLEMTRVCVYGMDFYEAPYFSHHSNKKVKAVQDYQKEKFKGMKGFVQNFIRSCPDVTFVFNTYASMDESIENLVVQ